MDFIDVLVAQVSGATLVQGAALIATFALMVGLQELFPARNWPKIPGWRMEALLFNACLFLTYVIVPVLVALSPAGQFSLLQLSWLGIWGAPLGVLVLSFAEYWFHRAEHRFDWMWRSMHQIHHYPHRVDVWGTAHGHPLEMAVQAFISTTVMVWFLGLDPAAAGLAGYFLTVLGLFQHMNIHTPRWIGYLISRPDAHFLHHERGVHGRNYSELPFWDMIFGTYENPERFEGEVGFAAPNHRRMADMLSFVDVETKAPLQPAAGASETRLRHGER